MYGAPPRRKFTDDWEWLAFAASLPGSPIQITNPTGNQLIYSGRCIATGVSIDNSGATTVVSLLDGQDSTGTVIYKNGLAGSARTNVALPGQGVLCEIGVYLLNTAGIIDGSVTIIPLWHYPFTTPGD